MDQLVRIEQKMIGKDVVDAVDARELWARLEVKSDFRNWIKNRIDDVEAQIGIDYITYSEKAEIGVSVNFERNLGGRPSIEYIITLDLAKHFAMLERSDMGRQIRQYFIDFEKDQKVKIAKEDKRSTDPLVVMVNHYLDLKEEQERQRDEQIKLLHSIIMHDQQIKDQKLLLSEQANSINEIKMILPQDGYYTVNGWCSKLGIKCPNNIARSYGIQASKLSKKMSIDIGKESDPVHGSVNSYHRDILEKLITKEKINKSYRQMEFMIGEDHDANIEK